MPKFKQIPEADYQMRFKQDQKILWRRVQPVLFEMHRRSQDPQGTRIGKAIDSIIARAKQLRKHVVRPVFEPVVHRGRVEFMIQTAYGTECVKAHLTRVHGTWLAIHKVSKEKHWRASEITSGMRLGGTSAETKQAAEALAACHPRVNDRWLFRAAVAASPMINLPIGLP